MSELARETLSGLSGARATLAQRLAKHTRGRRWAPSILPLLSEYSSRRACKLNECGRLLMARDAGAAGCAIQSYYCQQWKLCRICAARRSSKSLSILLPKIQRRMADDLTSRSYLVTLTIKGSPGDDCALRFNHLMKSVREYFRSRVEFKKGNSAQTEACKASGIFGAVETTRGAAGDSWHWHFHSIWVCPANTFLSHAALSREWEAITGDSYVVDIRELHASRGRRPGADVDPAALASDLAEVCKYAMKPQGLTPADCIEVQKATAARHFTRTYGSLRFTAAEMAELEADRPEVEHADAPARVFRWSGPLGYVELVKDALAAVDHHPRLLGARAVNLLEERAKRAASFAGGSAAPAGLDTGGKIGRSPPAPGAAAPHSPPVLDAGRLRRQPRDAENCFG